MSIILSIGLGLLFAAAGLVLVRIARGPTNLDRALSLDVVIVIVIGIMATQIVRTGDAERTAADLGARVGLDLRLDRRLTEHGFRGLFFRCGDAVVEVAAPIEPTGDPDSFGGLAWRSADIEATRERLVAGGVEVSEVRTGRKPGTRVATVRDRALGTPTLIIEQG